MHVALQQDVASSELPSQQSQPLARDLPPCRYSPRSLVSGRLVAEVKRGKAHGVRFAGDPVVLVRTESGKVFALKTAARIARSAACRRWSTANSIRCCYHGWTYDCTGRCIDVPYLGARAPAERVRSYPCREEAGLIFIFPGDPLLAETTPFPALGSVGDKPTKPAASAAK